MEKDSGSVVGKVAKASCGASEGLNDRVEAFGGSVGDAVLEVG